MRRITKVAIACLIASAASSAYADQKVRIIARAPANTPPTESLYIAGSLPTFGAWKADGLKLPRQPDGTFAASVDLPIGQTLDFKITRGTWASVEKKADGGDRPNRTITVDAATHQIEITVQRWATSTSASRPSSTVVGNLKLHTLNSQALKQPRTIRVWLPPEYDASANVRYGVLYMHDGQNCFDRATSAFGNEWEIDESLTKLIHEKRVAPLIVVGIDNGLANRTNELTYNAEARRGGGQGTAYTDFLLTEVRPLIDKTYRTRPDRAHTFIGGSSLGGLASLEIARRHPDTFGAVIAMSPTIWWADESILSDVKKDPGGLTGSRVWIDMGTRENIPTSATDSSGTSSQRSVDAARQLDAALTHHKIDHRLVIDDQHPDHNEPAWANRFPQAIAYILHAK